jgi:hypothetical protein
MKTTIPIEVIREHLAFRERLNKHKLEDLIITENGQPIEITPECLEEWRFIGMTNLSFFEMEFWKQPLEWHDDETTDRTRTG